MTPGRVRLATPSDAGAIATIHVRAWQTVYRGLVPDAILDGFDIDQRIARWTRVLETESGASEGEHRTWVIEDGAGPPVGFATSGPGRDESAPPPDGAGEVYAIYLATEAIGRGVGRALFTHAVTDLTSRGYASIVVWVFEANPLARRFYEAAGFHPDGARYTIDFDGTPIDEIRYRLDPA